MYCPHRLLARMILYFSLGISSINDMYDLICVGTTTVDLYFKGQSLHHDTSQFHLNVGGKYFTDFFYEGVGGGATNVAIGASKLGLRTALISEIGENPFKRVIYEKLDLAGVSRNHCIISHGYYNCSTVLLTELGEKTIINYRTHKSSLLHLLPDETLMSKVKALYLGNTAHIRESYRARLLKYAKSFGITTFVTLGAEDCRKNHTLIDDILKYTDVLLINSHECADLLRVPFTEIEWNNSIRLIASDLILPPLVVITNGADGSYGYAELRVLRQHAAYVPKIVDTTGAGDGYTAGFISGYLKTGGRDIIASMKSGTHYASVKLQHLGAN